MSTHSLLNALTAEAHNAGFSSFMRLSGLCCLNLCDFLYKKLFQTVNEQILYILFHFLKRLQSLIDNVPSDLRIVLPAFYELGHSAPENKL